MRSPNCSSCRRPRTPGASTVISSPPQRATMSEGRSPSLSRRTTSISTSSPTPWPNRSLIDLNRSRSTTLSRTQPCACAPGPASRRWVCHVASSNRWTPIRASPRQGTPDAPDPLEGPDSAAAEDGDRQCERDLVAGRQLRLELLDQRECAWRRRNEASLHFLRRIEHDQ